MPKPDTGVMDGNLLIPQHDLGIGWMPAIASRPCAWIPASMPEWRTLWSPRMDVGNIGAFDAQQRPING